MRLSLSIVSASAEMVLSLIHIFSYINRQGLDAGTAFEILSIDIADIDIGRNIGAALQIDQANADKNICLLYTSKQNWTKHTDKT